MEKNNLLKKCLFFSVLSIILLIVVCIMLRYEVEGEQNLPFSINKILVVSTVDGQRVDDPDNIWNINIKQINDLFVYIGKTNDNEGELIKEITIENFQVLKAPQKGILRIYRPTGELSNLYQYSEQDYLNNKITYVGEKIDDLKSLEISTSGGMLGFRVSLDELGSYISNESQEISYDGTLLNNIQISKEQIQTNMSFDLIIETNENIKFKGTVNIELPVGDIAREGSSNIEITNFKDVIFKRI